MPRYLTRDMRAAPALARGVLYGRDRVPGNLIWYRAFEDAATAPPAKPLEAAPCSET
jgi:hypothetical protein